MNAFALALFLKRAFAAHGHCIDRNTLEPVLARVQSFNHVWRQMVPYGRLPNGSVRNPDGSTTVVIQGWIA